MKLIIFTGVIVLFVFLSGCTQSLTSTDKDLIYEEFCGNVTEGLLKYCVDNVASFNQNPIVCDKIPADPPQYQEKHWGEFISNCKKTINEGKFMFREHVIGDGRTSLRHQETIDRCKTACENANLQYLTGSPWEVTSLRGSVGFVFNNEKPAKTLACYCFE